MDSRRVFLLCVGVCVCVVVCGGVGCVCVGGVCGGGGVCVRPGIQSEDQNQFFYIQSEDILTKRGQNFSPRFVTMCTVLPLP